MSKFLVNEDRVIQITPNGTWQPGTPNYTEIKADKLKLSGKKVLLNQISWTMSGCVWTGPPGQGGTLVSGAGNIMATSVKVKSNSQSILLEGDEGVCNGVINVNQPSGPPVPTPCSCKFKIVSAGQSKVKGK